MNSSSPRDTAPTMSLIDVNSPGHVDALGRTGFARELHNVIRSLSAEGGAVVGLEGEWGSGKTWVLDRLESVNDELGDKNKLLFVKFNPWMLSGSAEIVDAYLIQLASTLGTTDKPWSLQRGAEIAGKLIDYTRVFSTVRHFSPLANLLLPGSGLLLDAVGQAAGDAASATGESTGGLIDRWKKEPGKLSLAAAREAVRKLLQSAERKIAVLIDDLDRLAPAELTAMVQAVKAVADFPNVVYVLAYDPGAASHALESALRLRKDEGRRYLEKIVQIQVSVPNVPAAKMQGFAKQPLREVIQPFTGDEEFAKDVEEALPRAAALMQTPRDVVRLRTRLEWLLPKVAPEVNPADLLLAEALYLKVPDVVGFVNRHSRELLKSTIESAEADRIDRGEFGDVYEVRDYPRTEEDRLRQQRARRDELDRLAGNDRRLIVPVRVAMAFLLDATPRLLHGKEAHSSRLRLQQHRNWTRWRAAVGHSDEIENSEVIEWLARPATSWNDERVSGTIDSFLDFCRIVTYVAPECNEVDSVGFVSLFLEAAVAFGEGNLQFDSARAGYGPQDALIHVIRCDQPTCRVQAVEKLISGASVWLSEHVVWKAFADAFGTEGRQPVPPESRLIGSEADVQRLVTQWCEKAMDWLRDTAEPTPGQPGFTLAYWIWKRGGDFEAARSLLREVIAQRPRGLEVCFSDSDSYTDGHLQHFPFSGRELLPDPSVLPDALNRSPGFEANHGVLLKLWRELDPAHREEAQPAGG
jgi:hypothetical protein